MKQLSDSYIATSDKIRLQPQAVWLQSPCPSAPSSASSLDSSLAPRAVWVQSHTPDSGICNKSRMQGAGPWDMQVLGAEPEAGMDSGITLYLLARGRRRWAWRLGWGSDSLWPKKRKVKGSLTQRPTVSPKSLSSEDHTHFSWWQQHLSGSTAPNTCRTSYEGPNLSGQERLTTDTWARSLLHTVPTFLLQVIPHTECSSQHC